MGLSCAIGWCVFLCSCLHENQKNRESPHCSGKYKVDEHSMRVQEMGSVVNSMNRALCSGC